MANKNVELTKEVKEKALNLINNTGLTRAEIAEEMGWLVGQLNVFAKMNNVDWKKRKRVVYTFTIVEDPNQPEGEEKELTNIEL